MTSGRRVLALACAAHVVASCPVSAQEPTVARAAVTEGASPQALGLSFATLDALCTSTAQSGWAVERRALGSVMQCELRHIAASELFSVATLFGGGMRIYLAARDDAGLRLVHLLDVVEWSATETGDVHVVRTMEIPTRAGTALTIVTRAGFLDYAGTEVAGWDRRRVTVCMQGPGGVALRCLLTLPLSFESWHGQSPYRRHDAVDGYEVVHRESASAETVIHQDGTLQHSLRTGSWWLLYGGGWFSPTAESLPSEEMARTQHSLWTQSVWPL